MELMHDFEENIAVNQISKPSNKYNNKIGLVILDNSDEVQNNNDNIENIEYLSYDTDDNDEKVNQSDEEEEQNDIETNDQTSDKIIYWLENDDDQQKDQEENLENNANKESSEDVKIKNEINNYDNDTDEEYLNDDEIIKEEILENSNQNSIKEEEKEGKEEEQEQKKETNDDKDLYHCSTCNTNFYLINEHIEKYHKNEIIDIDDTIETESSLNKINDNNIILYDGNHDDNDHNLNDNSTSSKFVIIQNEKLNEIELNKSKRSHNENEIDEEENDKKPKRKNLEIDEVKHLCLQCNTILNSIDDVNKHVCKETEESVTSNLKRKQNKEQKDKMIACNICGALYCSNRSLALHKRIHKNSSNVNNINKDISNLQKIKEEIIKEFICEICNTKFVSLKSLKLHSKMHNSTTTLNSFDRIINNEKRIIGKSGHLSNENFWCEICEKFYNKVFQSIHEKSHNNEIKIICSICNKKFDNETECSIHMKLHENHPKRRGITKAESAGITLPYACSYCGREFKKPHEKVKHERIHTGEKPFKCDICGKCFRVSYCLTLHIRTHTNARPYVCSTCNKRFKSVSVYTHHLASHSDERAYKCPYCPKTFKTAVSLAGHRKSHTKPFTCVDCNRPFASLYAVKCHMETHKKSNKNLKHSCIVCGAIYAKIFALRDHMKEQHNDVVISEASTALTEVTEEGTIEESEIINDENIMDYEIIKGEIEVIEESILDDKDEITIAVVENVHTEEIITDELWLKQKL